MSESLDIEKGKEETDNRWLQEGNNPNSEEGVLKRQPETR